MLANKAILKTLCYADIFDFALTKDEIWRYLVNEGIKKEEFEEALKNFTQTKGFYFLEKRENLVAFRDNKHKYSIQKLNEAKKTVKLLSILPTVLFIGVSGTVAVENADKDDDIDFFVICKKDTVWFTRLLLLIFLQFLGKRRKRQDSYKVNNKICLNMLIDEDSLFFPKDKQDLYIAHEIVQVKPLFNKKETYERFLEQNLWVQDFLPNAVNRKLIVKTTNLGRRSFFTWFEPLARFLQKRYMIKHITLETVTKSTLAFHPFDYRSYVLSEYQKRLKQYKL